MIQNCIFEDYRLFFPLFHIFVDTGTLLTQSFCFELQAGERLVRGFLVLGWVVPLVVLVPYANFKQEGLRNLPNYQSSNTYGYNPHF